VSGGLGERGSRLRRVARDLSPAPIAVFYVQVPDEEEVRAIGWYMRLTRAGEPVYLGHSASAAELWLREEIKAQRSKTSVRKRKKPRQKA
jgi:hypothetical protein